MSRFQRLAANAGLSPEQLADQKQPEIRAVERSGARFAESNSTPLLALHMMNQVRMLARRITFMRFFCRAAANTFTTLVVLPKNTLRDRESPYDFHNPLRHQTRQFLLFSEQFMTLQIARPAIADLEHLLLARSVHPELYDRVARTHLDSGPAQVNLAITPGGHVLDIQIGRQVLTEIHGTGGLLIPENHRCVRVSISGNRDLTHVLEGGITYQCCFGVEKLEPEVFSRIQLELNADQQHATLGHHFGTGKHSPFGPQSVLFTDLQAKSFHLQAFHTFVETSTIVRCQTLIEF